MKKILYPVSLIIIGLMFSSWGSKGHRKISQSSVSSYPVQIEFLSPAWSNFVTYHASDADYRKDQDPDESPRHYIDIDNYPEFIQSGFINPSFDTAVFKHGYNFVIDQGILPWATLRCYDSLRDCFQRGDWNRSALYAADLGHYVADGHMPLHITRNYNGQYTGQNGIHSRFESSMIGRYENQLLYPYFDTAQFIPDVSGYVFGYLYNNYNYIDSLLMADHYADSLAGNTNSDAYYLALWGKSKYFTIELMRHGSYSLASLIYTAWVEAGSPEMYPNGIDDPENLSQTRFLPVYPDPVKDWAIFPLVVNETNATVTLMIYDSAGNLKDTVVNGSLEEGYHKIKWVNPNLSPGVYICVMKSGHHTSTQKMVLIN